MNQDLKIIKTVFMPGKKKGEKFMVSKREKEVKEKIQQPGLDFKQKVINFIENGSTLTKAAHTFGIGRASIYKQLSLPILEATKVKSRRNFIKKFGSKSIVLIDESGFEDNQDCIYTWSKKWKKVYGKQERKRGKRENLVVSRRKK